MKENLKEYKGKDIIVCPICGTVYELKEFSKLKSVRSILVDTVDTKECGKCGTEFGYVYRLGLEGSDKTNMISFGMDVDLIKFDDENKKE